MPTYAISAPDGNTYQIDGPAGASDDQVRAEVLRQHPGAGTVAPAKPKPPGYDKAMADLTSSQQLGRDANLRGGGKVLGGALNAMDDWQRQVVANTGAFDELAGGVNYLKQGATNLFRQATGKPIEVPAATAGQAAMDFERQHQAQYATQHPTGNAFATAATVAASARPTGAAAFANPFKAGAAAAVQQAPFAMARQQGDVGERLPGAARDTAIAFGAGTALSAAGNMFARGAAASRAQPSAARQLSAQGVDLTPGQMAGGIGQRIEDAATSLPITGGAINAARNRGIESFNEAALNQTLAPIGKTLPSTVDVGRDGLKTATSMISDAYKDALSGVKVAPDAQFRTELAAAKSGVPAQVKPDLDAVIADVGKRMRGGVDGATWKAVDADLGAAYRAADNASQQAPVQRFLRDAIGQVREAHAGLLSRTDAAAMAGVKAADTATANLVRVRQASQNAATASRAGVFTPAELNRAALSTDTSAGNRAFATGDALMQNLTEPGMQVLPSKMGDSGTAGRLVSAGAIYGGTGVLGGPHVGVGALATDTALSLAYSKPVQAAINAIYRATSPGQARAALAVLAKGAAQNPALVPAYNAALRRLGLAPASSSGPPAQPAAQLVATTP
jgi:hypothetical protein